MSNTPTIDNEMTDEQIVASLRATPELFGILIDRYQEPLARYIRRITNTTRDDQQDILQIVFVRAYEKQHRFDSSMSFKTWLYQICHNETIRYWQKHKKSVGDQSLDDDEHKLLEALVADSSFAEHIQQRSYEQTLSHALPKLSDHYRAILVLRFMEEKPYAEISDILQLPPGTVATHILRAKKSLAKIITTLS